MSKKLGWSYLSNFLDFDTGEIKKELPDFVVYNGFSYPVPRYYRKLLCEPSKEFVFTIDKLREKYGNEAQAQRILSQMRDIAAKKLQKYNDNSNL